MTTGAASAAVTTRPGELPFVGRSGPLAALVSAVQAAELGEHVVALVGGEPGIGKSRLAKELAALVSARVLTAACWQGEGAPAYWLWLQLLRGLPREPDTGAQEVERLLRRPSDDLGKDARFWVFDGVLEVLARASLDAPLLLVLEDLHWADEGSVRLLEFVAIDARPRRLAVLGTYRDTDLDPSHPLACRLGELARGGLHLALGGLGRRDVEELLRTSGRGPAAELVPALHRTSGGNPLFLRELLTVLPTQGDFADPSPGILPGLPAGVLPLVERRLTRLSAGTRAVLDAASVAGPDVDVPLLRAVTGTGEQGLLAAVDEARAAGLVVADGTGEVRFVHTVVREALYAALPLPERVDLHRRIADVLEQRYGDERPAEVAHHVLLGAVADGSGRAVDAAVRAADHSRTLLAWEQAATWYDRALQLMASGHVSGVRQDELLLRRGEAELASGDLPSARTSFAEAAAIARARRDPEQLARAALALGTGFGGFEVKLLDPLQVELLEEALSVLDPRPSALRACTLARLSVALSFMGDEARRLALSEQGIAVAREVGEPAVLGYALTGHCDAVPGPDHVRTRLAEATEAVRLAQQAADRRLELLARRLRLVALLESGDVGAADVEIERFARVAGELRLPLYRWYVPLWRGMRALMRGDLDAAARRCAEAAETGALARSENAEILTFAQWWVRKRYEGAFAEAGAAMGRVIEPVAGAPSQTPSGWPYPAVQALQTGDPERARLLLEQWVDSGVARPRDSEWLPESAQLAQAAVLAGSRNAAELLHRQLRPYADLFCVEGIGAAVTGSVAWYLAELARFLDRPDEARSFAEQAAAAHRRAGLVGDPPPLAASFAEPAVVTEPRTASLVWEGATWVFTWDGAVARLRDSKGVRDLAVLLSRPSQEVHCLEMVGGADVGGEAGPVLDAQARRAYEQRIRDLQEDIDDAHADHDAGRAERAEAELDALVQQLSGAFGLSGRNRATGSAAERARSAVGWRIRAALRSVAEVHPPLARHLQHAVKTGTWCSYRPETPVPWRVERGQGRSA